MAYFETNCMILVIGDRNLTKQIAI
jgi:hypothetical protein